MYFLSSYKEDSVNSWRWNQPHDWGEILEITSVQESKRGGRGVVNGPHKKFTNVHKNFNFTEASTFLAWSEILEKHYVSFIGYKEDMTTKKNKNQLHLSQLQNIESRVFEEVDRNTRGFFHKKHVYKKPTCRIFKN